MWLGRVPRRVSAFGFESCGSCGSFRWTFFIYDYCRKGGGGGESVAFPNRARHAPAPPILTSPSLLAARGTKRKFDFDTTDIESATRQAEEAALRQIEKEQNDARRAKLPAFWLPSLMPSSNESVSLKDVKLQTVCRMGGTAHAIRYVKREMGDGVLTFRFDVV